MTFANEIGSLAKAQGLDGQRVMDTMCADTKLNLSRLYLRPGFAFGGSCLPKDVRALRDHGRRLDLDLPLLNAFLPSNAQQLDRGIAAGAGRGLARSVCSGSRSRREPTTCARAPWSRLSSGSSARDMTLRIYDGNVNLAKLVGANRDYILEQIPHISDLAPVEHRRGRRPRPHPGDRQQRPGVSGGRRAPTPWAADCRPRPHHRATQRWERVRGPWLVNPDGSSSSSRTCPSRSTAGCG